MTNDRPIFSDEQYVAAVAGICWKCGAKQPNGDGRLWIDGIGHVQKVPLPFDERCTWHAHARPDIRCTLPTNHPGDHQFVFGGKECADKKAQSDFPPFNVGDVVYLKSGSPKMTVVDYGSILHENAEPTETVDVTWFSDYDAAPLKMTFQAEALAHAHTPEHRSQAEEAKHRR